MTLIDASGPVPRPDMAIITDGERIAMVFPAKQLEVIKLARMEVVDAAGLTVLPGVSLDAEAVQAALKRGAAMAEALQSVLGGRCIRGGALADLIFVRGNPLKHPAALRQVAFVVRRGVRQGGSTPA